MACVVEGSLGDSLICLPSLRLFLAKYSHAETLLISLGPLASLGASNLFKNRLPFTKFVHIKISSNESSLKRFFRWLQLVAILRLNRIQECVYGIRSENIWSLKRAESHQRILKIAGCKILAGDLDHESLKISHQFPNKMQESVALNLFKRVGRALFPNEDNPPFEFHFPLTPADEKKARDWLFERGISNRRRVAICLGSKSPIRWKVENYQAVLEGLISKFDVVPILFGGKDEVFLAEKVCRNITQSQNALGLPIGTVAGLMSLCDLYIGNDTGPMHLAASVGTTCVAIFSARAPRGHWYPLGEKHLIFRDDIDCAGCHFQTCDVRKLECLDFIQPQDVLNACSNLLTKNISSRG